MQEYDDASIRTKRPMKQEFHRKNPDGTYTILKPLAMRDSLDSQLRAFANMRASDPASAKEVYDLNEQILRLACNGSLRKLQQTIEGVPDPKHILIYYIVKAFKAALIGGHLMIAGYFIDQGFPYNTTKVPHILLEVLAIAHPPYYLGDVPDGKLSEDSVLQIVEFLIMKNKAASTGVKQVSGTTSDPNDIEIVNLAARGTWLTALHVCIRYGLFSIIDLLLENNADVNAVGDGDIMPLGLAYRLRDNLSEKVFQAENDIPSSIALRERVVEIDESNTATTNMKTIAEEKVEALREAAGYADTLVRKLLSKGARETWRRGNQNTTTTVFIGSSDNNNNTKEKPKKSMVKGFAGTVDKNTTPTVDDTLALLKLQIIKEREEEKTNNLKANEAVGTSETHKDKEYDDDSGNASYYTADDGGQLFSTG